MIPSFSSSHEESRPETIRTKSVWREYTEAIIIALVLALTIRVFLVQGVQDSLGFHDSQFADRRSYPGQ